MTNPTAAGANPRLSQPASNRAVTATVTTALVRRNPEVVEAPALAASSVCIALVSLPGTRSEDHPPIDYIGQHTAPPARTPPIAPAAVTPSATRSRAATELTLPPGLAAAGSGYAPVAVTEASIEP